jgi:hypothetical protein
MQMKPKRPETVGHWEGAQFVIDDPSAFKINNIDFFKVMQNAVEPDVAADLFDDWFTKLKLPFRKKIAPLGQNWPFDREFLIDWLGYETFSQFFDYNYRDLKTSALFLNDQADALQEPAPFAKVSLQWICKQLGVENSRAHRAMEDCLATAECYRRLLNFTGHIKVPGIDVSKAIPPEIPPAPKDISLDAKTS